MTPQNYEATLKERQRELQLRLRRIEADFEEPRNPDDDDRASERSNDEVLEELGEAGQRELQAIDAALERIAERRFGVCVRCGETTAEERLAVVPQTPFCSTCAAAL